MKTREQIINGLVELKDYGSSNTQVHSWGMYEDMEIGHFYIDTMCLTGTAIQHINKNIGEIIAISAEDKDKLRVTFRWN